ncbi:hypothetical protein [Dyadobacter sp. CY312]|uniref:hypothetical protein n=1 Tax=Dyadobacter sp. CY312 TaxID=2907303 RepID=UPI001F22116B|nr:hypothetical protein [Dyadobacter sp. CY312]MCE7044604.1 hypothetical protein [Dyadobacter sp. CY312]
MSDTIPKLTTKTIIVLSIFFYFLFGCKDKIVDPHLVTDNGVMVDLSPLPWFPPWSNIPKSAQENDARLPKSPACDSLPVEHHNFKISVHKASPSESPLFQNCSFTSETNFVIIGKGTKIVVDVSYYKGVKKVRVPVTSSGNNPNKSSKAAYVILKDSEGMVIASDSVKTDDGKILVFNDNLEKLKEIIVINCNSDRALLSFFMLSNKIED